MYNMTLSTSIQTFLVNFYYVVQEMARPYAGAELSGVVGPLPSTIFIFSDVRGSELTELTLLVWGILAMMKELSLC